MISEFKPLLTIAIPTFNRAMILDGSLKRILPQVSTYAAEIEFVISDNASSDNTQYVINKYLDEYPDLNIVTYLQPYNTGYYGNFKKCKELSTGKYFWLLSDNEHILDEVIDFLIECIKVNPEVGAYHLENLQSNAGISNQNKFSIIESEITDFMCRERAYRITLTSAVIMLNDKTFDTFVEEQFNGNTFLGFLYLCNTLRKNNKINIITGNTFIQIPTKVTFNIFQSFTVDLKECSDYLTEHHIITEELKNTFITNILTKVVKDHVYISCLKGKVHGKSYGSPQELKNKLDLFYHEYPYYRNQIIPILNKPGLLLKIHDILTKIISKLKKTVTC